MSALLVVLVVPVASVGCEGLIGADFDVTRVECRHRSPPPPPPAGNYAGDAVPQTLAARRIDVGDTGGLETIGLDLDNLCTNKSEGPGCRTPEWSTTRESTDGDDGIDNAIGRLIAAQSKLFGTAFISSPQLSKDIEEGASPPSIAIRISQYNGAFRDEKVKVEWFMPALGNITAPARPRWDEGSVEVPLDERSVTSSALGSIQPNVVDPAAYVEKGVLVARFFGAADRPLLLRLGRSAIALHSAILVAEVPPGGKSFTRATLSGRVETRELLRQIAAFTGAQLNGDPICKDSAIYPAVKEYICGFADLTNRTGPNEPCDLLSFGLSIELAAVQLGPVGPTETGRACRADADPVVDTCDGPALPADPSAADASAPDGRRIEGNCVPEGTRNNAFGVGAGCTTPEECPEGFCTATFGAPAGKYFCTKLCATPGATCGEGVHCVASAQGTACVPDTCAPDGG